MGRKIHLSSGRRLYPYIAIDELKHMKNGDFLLDCSEIELKSHSLESPDKYFGPGYIKQTKDGILVFKLYSSDKTGQMDAFNSLARDRAGRVIPHEEYFKLTACDTHGREWICERILPNWDLGPNGLIITGEVNHITVTLENCGNPEKKQIKLLSFDKIDIPANTHSESRDIVAGDEKKSWNLNVAKFKSDDLSFCLTNKSDELELLIEYEKDWPAQLIETRAHEALLFVLGKSINWSVVERVGGKYVTVKVLQRPSRPDFEFFPPINTPSIDHTGYSWKLFDRYFQHIIKDKREGWHPLSERVYSIIDATKISFLTGCLLLCISIEWMLDIEFPDLAQSSSIYIDFLHEFKKMVKEWKEERSHDFTDVCKEKKELEKLTDRILGVLGLIKNSRPKDKLEALVKSAAIKKEHMNVWIDVRPKLSHGAYLREIESQVLVDYYFKLITLFYNLIFHKIGYSGSYSNYSKEGFHIEGYPFKPLTNP